MTLHYGVNQSNLIACFVLINDPNEKDSPSAHQSNTNFLASSENYSNVFRRLHSKDPEDFSISNGKEYGLKGAHHQLHRQRRLDQWLKKISDEVSKMKKKLLKIMKTFSVRWHGSNNVMMLCLLHQRTS
ncbi:hypothetical protein L5515_001948 [Caenorhabditis briggsae]|uniref:Uncharacterized protein n=1 Tax=Caenorhabditis briggsae TaxID=6238 RepID=A0AAE9J480_CAEBR|nr:hypothetical protein L5515_001948 [Caenorhabditis briggsae]